MCDAATRRYPPRPRGSYFCSLVEAAAAAGAEVRQGFTVDEVVIEGERVTGIRGHGADGRSVTEHARIVIGADGMRSLVARAVRAPEYHTHPELGCGYYSYWSGMPCDGAERYWRAGRMLLAFPTNDDQTCVIAAAA